jgi:hypothetical protein
MKLLWSFSVSDRFYLSFHMPYRLHVVLRTVDLGYVAEPPN